MTPEIRRSEYRQQYPEFVNYEPQLQSISQEIIPMYYPSNERRTLYGFLPPVIHDIKTTSDRVSRGEIPLQDARKKVLFMTGVPGSGKSTIGESIQEMLFLAGVNPEHISSEYWDVAQGGADHGDRIAQVLDSDEDMKKFNENAYASYHANKNWIVKIDEKAPMVRRNKYNAESWDGRDAGATYMERIVREEQNTDFFNFNFCPEARLRYYPGPNRKSGAFANQSTLYDTFATGFALERRADGSYRLPVPEYLTRVLNDKYWMEEGFISESGFPYKDVVNSFAYHSVRKNALRYTNQARPYTESQRLEEFNWFRRWAIKMDCSAIAGLTVTRDFMMNELGIDRNNIYMGMNCPPMQKFAHLDYTLDDYFRDLKTSDLKK